MDDLQKMAAKCALRKMEQQGYFSICTIDSTLSMTRGIGSGDDYRILRTLHCVDFKDMPAELLRGLPLLIARVLGSDAIDLTSALTGQHKQRQLN